MPFSSFGYYQKNFVGLDGMPICPFSPNTVWVCVWLVYGLRAVCVCVSALVSRDGIYMAMCPKMGISVNTKSGRRCSILIRSEAHELFFPLCVALWACVADRQLLDGAAGHIVSDCCTKLFDIKSKYEMDLLLAIPVAYERYWESK